MDFDGRARAHDSGFNRPWRSSREIRQKNLLDRSQILRRLQQSRTPLREDGCDLVSILFGDKIIKSSLCFEQQSVEGPGHPIMRMQVEFTTRQGLAGRLKTVKGRPAETAQTCRNQGRRGSLAAPNQKVAPTQVEGARGGRVPHLIWPTQNDVSRMPTCRLKLTPAHTTVKIRPAGSAGLHGIS